MRPDKRLDLEKTCRLAADHEAYVASLRELIALEKLTVKTIEQTRALIAELDLLLQRGCSRR
jgi:hypothetical protein